MDDDARDAAVVWWPEKRIPLSSCHKPLATMLQARLRPFPGSPQPQHHCIIHKGPGKIGFTGLYFEDLLFAEKQCKNAAF